MATEFHIERDNNTIFIGENTSMHGRGTKTVHFALDEGTNVVVGEDCMFSNDIQIRSSDSHSILDLGGKRLNQADDIVIGKHCWLGLRCMLLRVQRYRIILLWQAELFVQKVYGVEYYNCRCSGQSCKTRHKLG